MEIKKKERAIRKPNKFEAFSCLVVMIVCLTFGTINGVNVSAALAVAVAYVIIIGIRCGYKLSDLLDAMNAKVADLVGLFFILPGIGYLIATFVYAGTIPTLIYYLLQIVPPNLCVLFAFLLTAITAVLIGTSFGTCGTIGVAMMGLGVAMGVNLPLLAGAVVSGSHVGLFLSPMADNFNLVASVSKKDSMTVIKRAMYIAGPTFLVCIAFYTIMGFVSGTSGTAVDSNELCDGLSAIFNINPIALLPLILVCAASALRVPAVISLFGSGFVAIITGWLLNGFDFWKGLSASYSGFSLADTAGISTDGLMPEIITLCDRGGMTSMASVFVILFVAMAFAGVLIKIQALEVIIDTLFGKVKSAFGLALYSWIISALTVAMTSSSYIGQLMPIEMLSSKYEELGYSYLDCAVVSNTVSGDIMCIIPWTSTGIYMSGVVGVACLEYAPYCIWGWGLGVMGIILSIFAFGYQKRPKQKA